MKAQYNIDTGCVEICSAAGKLSIMCNEIEDMMELSRYQRSEFDRLVYDHPLEFAELLLTDRLEAYLKGCATEHKERRRSIREQLLERYPPSLVEEITNEIMRDTQ
jgi:hypothetical protein